jgi:hypothetical protein
LLNLNHSTMKLSEVKSVLESIEEVRFTIENGDLVPAHVHITEVGQVNKHFIDCGGTVRRESKVSFQLWFDEDTEHRLSSNKLLTIIELSEKSLAIEDLEVEVEYQQNTIGKYGLEFENGSFILTSTLTDCLAKDKCGIPENKVRVSMANLSVKEDSCCSPESGCC